LPELPAQVTFPEHPAMIISTENPNALNHKYLLSFILFPAASAGNAHELHPQVCYQFSRSIGLVL